MTQTISKMKFESCGIQTGRILSLLSRWKKK